MTMQSIGLLQTALDRAVALFKTFDPSKSIRIISHLDADGISACSILISALNQENRKNSVSIVPQLSLDKLTELAKEEYEIFFFTDLGSGNLSQIEKLFKSKKVIILDHHEPEKHTLTDDNIVLVNPHSFGINGSKTISGAGVVFLFIRELNKKYENLAHIAVIGAIGDMQESGGFTGLNQDILELAVKHNKLRVFKGLKCFGQNSRPLYKVLEYSSDPYIPGVSNSESGAIQFLNQIDISPRNDLGWRKVSDLSNDEMQRLIAGIIMRRMAEKCPDDVIGNIYQLVEEPIDSPLRDVREFSTMLNSCGRMDKASLGIGLCLGDKETKEKAIRNQNNYRKEIVKALNWYDENKNSEKVIGGNGYIIINAGDNVLHTIIGTMASILAKGNSITPDTYILSMARNPLENQTKISLRYSSMSHDKDLHSILARIIEKTGGETGGHANAAGAVITSDKEMEFISTAKLIFESSMQTN